MSGMKIGNGGGDLTCNVTEIDEMQSEIQWIAERNTVNCRLKTDLLCSGKIGLLYENRWFLR